MPAFNHYFGGFGFWEAFRTQRRMPRSIRWIPTRRWPPAEWTLERMRNVKYALAGTAPTRVKRGDRGAAQDRAATARLRMVSAGSSTRASCRSTRRLRQMETFAKHIIPAFH